MRKSLENARKQGNEKGIEALEAKITEEEKRTNEENALIEKRHKDNQRSNQQRK